MGRARKGRRGFFVLGERPPGAGATSLRPMVAWGTIDRHGVHVESGVVAPNILELLTVASIP